jgi:NifU-like protein involved in Fe-S cluster formation
MVGPQWRDLLVAGELAGECDGPGVVGGSAEHPACGDQVQLSLRLEHGRIVEARWRASGCPASLAVAALAARILDGVDCAAAAAALRTAIAARGGLAAHERHAEALVLQALAAALGGR